MKKSLQEIYENYKTNDGWGDKGTIHSYIDPYAELLEPYRENGNILEIGIFYGHSIKMWREYFINGKVVGVDIIAREGVDALINDSKYKIIISDATQPQFIQELGDLKFDVIIDDGSHYIEHQVATFNMLKDFVNPNGLYIIEDVQNIEQEKSILEKLHNNSYIIDNRHINGRYDDILFVYKF
jgi:cephalosporin hydroxylase